jgi:hypothetical protein
VSLDGDLGNDLTNQVDGLRDRETNDDNVAGRGAAQAGHEIPEHEDIGLPELDDFPDLADITQLGQAG